MSAWLDRFGAGRHAERLSTRCVWRGEEIEIGAPVVVLRHGDGPTALLTGGVHGDEFEGQAAATAIARETRLEQVRGTLIVCPTVNAAACVAGRRRAPLDDADINRLFTGAADPRPSAGFARLFMETLLPGLDVLLDLHSGGVAHEFVLSSNYQGRWGAADTERDLPALLGFGAPWAIVFDEVEDADSMPHAGTLEAAARAAGARAFSSELGGGGRLTALSRRTATDGARGLLRHVGVLAEGPMPEPTPRERVLRLSAAEHYLSVECGGVFAPLVGLGDTVEPGAAIAEIFDPSRPDAAPAPVTTIAGGVVAALAATGRIASGALVAMIAPPVDWAP